MSVHEFLALVLVLSVVRGAPAQEARIEGSVVATGSDRPLQQARVRLPGLDREIRSGGDGAFVFRDVPAGQWQLEAELEGHVPNGFTVEVPEEGTARVVVELTPVGRSDASLRPGTIRGTIRAEASLEPIPYAAVRVEDSGQAVVTDQRGFFVLSGLDPGEHALRITAPGYRPGAPRVLVSAGEATTVAVPLERAPLELEGIEVEGQGRTEETAGPGFDRVDAALIDRLPPTAEPDVIRSLQMLPSIQPISDFSSALYIRGGASDQTLITLDGVPVFNPYHLGGIFSAIDPDAVATVDVHPGALPAHLGGRLSGAVQIWTREGGRDRIRGQGAVSLISSRAGLDGPMPVGDGTFLFSLRRTYLDLLTSMAQKVGLTDRTIPYHFTDAHLKLTQPVGATGTLTGSFYVDTEELTNRAPTSASPSDDDRFGWGSRVFSLSHRQLLGDRLLLEAKAGFSSFRGTVDFFTTRSVPGGTEPETFRTVRGRTYMRDALGRTNLTWYAQDHRVRLGAQIDGYLLDYAVDHSDGFYEDILPPFESRRTLTTFSAYLEDAWEIGDRVRLRLGGRVLGGDGHVAWMPRLGVNVGLTSSLTLRAGGGGYAQVLRSLRNEESLLASFLAYDLLTPVDSAGFARARDAVLGLDWRNDLTRIEVTAYLKEMDNLPHPPLPLDPAKAPVIVTEGFQRGSGRTTGIELSIRRQWGEGGALQSSYTLSSAERTLDGFTYTPRYHRRHFLDVLATQSWDGRGSLSARLVAASGQPTTPVVGRYGDMEYDPVSDRFVEGFDGGFVLGRLNSERLPGYWRVDVAARREFETEWFGRSVTLTPYLQVTNVLNTRNVLVARPQARSFRPGGQNEHAELEYLPMIPILPTFGLEWRF